MVTPTSWFTPSNSRFRETELPGMHLRGYFNQLYSEAG